MNNTNNAIDRPLTIDPVANADILTFKNVVLPKALNLWGSAHLAAGCFVTLHCRIDGMWEIIDKAGTTSFEP